YKFTLLLPGLAILAWAFLRCPISQDVISSQGLRRERKCPKGDPCGESAKVVGKARGRRTWSAAILSPRTAETRAQPPAPEISAEADIAPDQAAQAEGGAGSHPSRRWNRRTPAPVPLPSPGIPFRAFALSRFRVLNVR